MTKVEFAVNSKLRQLLVIHLQSLCYFPSVFKRGQKHKGRLFLQDDGPRQNLKVAHKAIESIGCRLFEIPPRSPDINPIENMFHLILCQLTEDALQYNITK